MGIVCQWHVCIDYILHNMYTVCSFVNSKKEQLCTKFCTTCEYMAKYRLEDLPACTCRILL